MCAGPLPPSETFARCPDSRLTALTDPRCRPLDAALTWLDFGFDVIPVVPGTKRTAVAWDLWLQRLTRGAVIRHWSCNPAHDIGFIVGPRYLVLDPDSAEALGALRCLEGRFGLAPLLRVKTPRGGHHFYRLAPQAVARTSTQSVATNARHIDVKSGRTMVVLPPSGGRFIVGFDELAHASELSVADQPFIDAVFANNGEPPPRETDPVPSAGPHPAPRGAGIPLLRAALSRLDPDLQYDTWLRVGAIVFNESGGSEDGLELFDSWSSEGSKYRDPTDTRRKWGSFRLDHPRPLTLATLRWMLRAAGHDWAEVCADAEPFVIVAEEST